MGTDNAVSKRGSYIESVLEDVEHRVMSADTCAHLLAQEVRRLRYVEEQMTIQAMLIERVFALKPSYDFETVTWAKIEEALTMTPVATAEVERFEIKDVRVAPDDDDSDTSF